MSLIIRRRAADQRAMRASWPPLHWKLLGFLGGLCLMLNHFHDQGIRYLGSEVWLRIAAIQLTPVFFFAAGLLAMGHARSVSSAPGLGVGPLLASTLVGCAIAFVPLVGLEMALFPTGHGAMEGFFVALRHLPAVGVFLAGLWTVAKLYRSDRRILIAILAPAPAGWAFGSALVYAIVFARRVGFHWERCGELASFAQRAMCIF
jgi:hypothetical protein